MCGEDGRKGVDVKLGVTCHGCQFSESDHTGPDCPMRRIGVKPSFSAGCNLFRLANATLRASTSRQNTEPSPTPAQGGDRGKDRQKNATPDDFCVRITLTGQVRGGKNNMGVTKTGIHYPKPEWARWRDAMLTQVQRQFSGDPIECECKAVIRYWAGDRKRRDIPAILDAIWHVLERSGIVKDDALIKSVEFHGLYDKENPKAVIVLTPLCVL